MNDPSWKYSEDELLNELRAYLAKTYRSHYAGTDSIQAIDLIAAQGHLEGFAVGNILKYGSRYGKKNGHNPDDLLKVIHYALFALWELKKNDARRPDDVLGGPDSEYGLEKRTSDK
jgi:hypothetical protein